MAVDTFPLGNYLPNADSDQSASLGLRASAMSQFSGNPEQEAIQENSSPAALNPATIGNQKNVLLAGVMFFALLIVLMFTAKHLGEDGEFKNIKVSFYNALIITLAVVVVLPPLKFVASKVPIPGVSAWVNAA